MDKIQLSDKAEKEIVKEIVNATKMTAFASYTENSQNLMTIEEIALYQVIHFYSKIHCY